jgi:hypothetical protein
VSWEGAEKEREATDVGIGHGDFIFLIWFLPPHLSAGAQQRRTRGSHGVRYEYMNAVKGKERSRMLLRLGEEKRKDRRMGEL